MADLLAAEIGNKGTARNRARAREREREGGRVSETRPIQSRLEDIKVIHAGFGKVAFAGRG